MRFKIVDKAGLDSDPNDSEKPLSINQRLSESTSITTLNSCRTEKITFQPNNDKGYSLICESMAPYDIFTINLELEMLTNKDNLELEKVDMIDPLVYSDVYNPYKYGIIFKEKIFVGQDTSAAFNISLMKKGKIRKLLPPVEGEQVEEGVEPRYEEVDGISELFKNFKVEIFDNKELVSTYNGNGHLTVSHFNFKSNAGLEDKPKPPPVDENAEPPAEQPDIPEKEYKHYYVIQATFDKNDWPACTQKNIEDTKDITWNLRIYSSDTVAIVKDTDKEDRENALKASWETAEPGRADKSHKSRVRYLAMVKQQNGEPLTEEEKEVLNQKRVRGAASLKEPVPDPKAAKGKAPAKGQPVEEDNKQEEVQINFPTTDDYTNLHLREFIRHFESDRLIHTQCDKKNARLRSEEEKAQIAQERAEKMESWNAVLKSRLENREIETKDREEKQKQTLDLIINSRKDFIGATEKMFAGRTKYRELISNRKYKEILLVDILNAEKIDIQNLENALREARDALVKQSTLDTANKKLEVLKYSKGVEEELQAAAAEKNGEKMREIIEKIEREALIIEPKIFNDAKNALAKMK